MKRLVWSVLLLFGLATPAAYAQALNGVVTSYVDLYAGPDAGYPTIAQLPAGTAVSIQGCTQGWGWCDVITQGLRGWVAATFVQYLYQSQPVYVADYGARIGIPIVAFSIGAYWGSYYTNRPFYRNRDYWYSRPYAPRPPPRPPGWHPGARPPAHGYRPPNGGYRPPPNGGHRPPPQGNRPPPNGDHRPPPQGNRPPPNQGHRPPSNNRPPQNPGTHPPGQTRPPGGAPPQGHRPPPNQGGHPPPNQGGNRPPSGHGNSKPAPKPHPESGKQAA
jgi:uncharacterized protein YraI